MKLPESVSAEDRIAKLKKIVTDSSGSYLGPADLDANGKELLQVLQKYDEAKAKNAATAYSTVEAELDKLSARIF